MNTPALMCWAVWLDLGVVSALWPWDVRGRWTGPPVYRVVWKRWLGR